MVNSKREGLEYIQRQSNWLNGRVPEIMTATEAYAIQAPHRRFYTVAWWGDENKQLPAGFTHFDFQQAMHHMTPTVNYNLSPKRSVKRKRASSSYHMGKFVPQTLLNRLKCRQ